MRSINMKEIDCEAKPSGLFPFILMLSILFSHKNTKEHTNYVSMCFPTDNMGLPSLSENSAWSVYSGNYTKAHANM